MADDVRTVDGDQRQTVLDQWPQGSDQLDHGFAVITEGPALHLLDGGSVDAGLLANVHHLTLRAPINTFSRMGQPTRSMIRGAISPTSPTVHGTGEGYCSL